MNATERLAIIQEPRFGVGDYGKVCLTFTAYVTENAGALQVFDAEEGTRIIESYGSDVQALQGKPCWVTCDGPKISWLRPWGRFG